MDFAARESRRVKSILRDSEERNMLPTYPIAMHLDLSSGLDDHLGIISTQLNNDWSCVCIMRPTDGTSATACLDVAQMELEVLTIIGKLVRIEHLGVCKRGTVLPREHAEGCVALADHRCGDVGQIWDRHRVVESVGTSERSTCTSRPHCSVDVLHYYVHKLGSVNVNLDHTKQWVYVGNALDTCHSMGASSRSLIAISRKYPAWALSFLLEVKS